MELERDSWKKKRELSKDLEERIRLSYAKISSLENALGDSQAYV